MLGDAKGMLNIKSIRGRLDLKKAKTVVKQKLTKIISVHYVKLAYRSLLLVSALAIYVINRINGGGSVFDRMNNTLWTNIVMLIIWLVLVVEMIFRFFPSKLESMGCQKQFKRNYKPINEDEPPKMQEAWRTIIVAAVWIAFNAIFAVLYFLKIIDKDVLLLIALAYSVCDMICILFFCPFQTWFMKNRCCGTCRIYNWDFAMMCTPLIFIPNFYTWSLLVFSILLLIRWELTALRHPERFCENKNDCLSCKNCKEKLCSHKTQLKSYLKKYRERIK